MVVAIALAVFAFITAIVALSRDSGKR